MRAEGALDVAAAYRCGATIFVIRAMLVSPA
jgi:hypothetical protein